MKKSLPQNTISANFDFESVPSPHHIKISLIFFEAYDFYNTAEYTNLVSGRTPKKMNAGTPDGFTVICPICVDTLSVQKCVLADWCLLAIYVQGSDSNFCSSVTYTQL